MAKWLVFGVALGCMAAVTGCGGGDEDLFGGVGAGGVGDAGVDAAGGSSGKGGGGQGGTQSGGAAGQGGSSGTAGSAGAGGQAGAGGAAGLGGNAGTGGVAGEGGTAGTGGVAGEGGTAGTGGAAGEGGTAGTGGAAGEGGTAGTGGVAGEGGTAGTGGLAGAGGIAGAAGTGGVAGTGGIAGAAGTGGVAGAGGIAGSAGTGGSGGPVCGNGTLEAPEECDDGNLTDGDGCSQLCVLEPAALLDKCPGLPLVLTGSGAVRSGTATGSTTQMLHDYAGTCGGSTAKDVVYSIKPDISGTMNLNLGGPVLTPFDAVLYVRSTCTDPSELACDDAITKGDEVINLQVTAGQTYYVILDGYSSASGSYTLNVKVTEPGCGNTYLDPGEECDDGNTASGDGCSALCKLESGSNDVCPGNTLALTQSGSTWVASISGSTAILQPDYQGTCGSSSAAKDAVYQFNAGPGGSVTAKLPVASFDSVLYARSGSCASGAQLGCKDTVGNGGEILTFNALPATDYWLFVDGYQGASGTFTLDIAVTPAVCGNNKLEGGEQCDDGNLQDGDGCSSTCQFEAPGANNTCPGQVLTLVQSGSTYVAQLTGSTYNLSNTTKGSCISSSTANDAVYQFNSGPGGKVRAEFAAANFDTVLYARSGSCDAGMELACDDDLTDGAEVIEFNAAPNTDYWLFVDGYSSESGTFSLKVSVTPAVCGNGLLEGAEQCDDGNSATGDGCTQCMWEGACGTLAEVEPNPYNTPQQVPQQCGSFQVLNAAMPLGDADYFEVQLLAGSTLTAATFASVPGTCNSGIDTVLSLWNGPMAATQESGGCGSGYLACNDQDSSNSPCSKITWTIPTSGTYILKVHNYYTSKAIASYGLWVNVK